MVDPLEARSNSVRGGKAKNKLFLWPVLAVLLLLLQVLTVPPTLPGRGLTPLGNIQLEFNCGTLLHAEECAVMSKSIKLFFRTGMGGGIMGELLG